MKKKGGSSFIIAAPLLLSLLLFFPTTSFATDYSDKLSINGFFTIDATLTDGENVSFPSGGSKPYFLEKDEVSFDNSLVGVQVDYEATDDLKLTIQVVSGNNEDNDYSPTLEWAYFSYDFGDDLYLRGGKLKLPFMQGTELRYVGFSRLWVRPLVSIDGAGGFDDYVGAEIIKGASFGEYNVKFQGSYGVAEHEQDAIDNTDVKLISMRIEKDESWINLALFHARFEVYNRDRSILFSDSAEKFMASLESEFIFDLSIINAGVAFGNSDFSPDEELAYLSIGYRAKGWTPYLLAKYNLMRFDADGWPRPPSGILPPDVLIGERKINSLSLGFRYNLGATYAIKAEAGRSFVSDDSNKMRGELNFEYNVYTIVFEGVF